FLCLALFLPTTYAQVVVRHSGANNPLTEGFVFDWKARNTEVGPVLDDGGRDAWLIKHSSVEDTIRYIHPLTERQGADAMTYGWELSTTVRFVDMPPASGLTFQTGNESFRMRFETHPIGGLLRVSDNRGTAYTLE